MKNSSTSSLTPATTKLTTPPSNNNNNATNRFLQNNYQHVIEKKRTSRDYESIQHQRSNKKFKTTTTNLTIEQRERIRYNKEMALKKLQAKQRKQQQYRL